VQDAVAAANALAGPLRRGTLTEKDLADVQRRRRPPTTVMQSIQVLLHRRITRPGGLAVRLPDRLPAPVGAAGRVALPAFRWLAARLIGLGFRPEHVHVDAG